MEGLSSDKVEITQKTYNEETKLRQIVSEILNPALRQLRDSQSRLKSLESTSEESVARLGKLDLEIKAINQRLKEHDDMRRQFNVLDLRIQKEEEQCKEGQKKQRDAIGALRDRLSDVNRLIKQGDERAS